MVLSQFIHPGVSFASVIQKTKKTSKTTGTKSTSKGQSASVKNNSTKPDATLSLNPKRKLSGDDEDVSPSSKSNRFESLIDEMDAELVKCNNDTHVESLLDICSSSKTMNNTASCITMQAEIYAPPRSREMVGSPALVDLGESTGAVSLDGLVELSGTPSLGGSAELPGEPPPGGSDGPLRVEPSAGFWELAEAAALADSGGSASVDDPIKLVASFDDNKPSPKPIPRRRIKVPNKTNKELQKPNKNSDEKDLSKTSEKGSSKQ